MANGDYIVEVRTHSYNNPRSLLADGNCCDYSNLQCAVPGCDNVFYYCLRTIGSYSSRERCNGGMMSPYINNNDSPLNFSQPIVLGLPNPLPLRGLTREWTVSIITSSLYTVSFFICNYVCRKFNFFLKLLTTITVSRKLVCT